MIAKRLKLRLSKDLAKTNQRLSKGITKPFSTTFGGKYSEYPVYYSKAR
jgi:hypothetical protein